MSFNKIDFANCFIKQNVLDSSAYKKDRFIKKDDECFMKTLSRFFNISINCKHFDSVINGQGVEKEKIMSLYSSSLQSLLIFSQVSKENKIIVDNKAYDEVYFEYKNKAFGYPSSIDVVLVNREEERILFIESKLGEIIRDSSDNGTYEIGPSYFSSNGFPKIIKNDKQIKAYLSEIGVDIKNLSIKSKNDRSAIKKLILKNADIDHDKNGWVPVKNIDNRKYVYSYGIKQLLSHALGIFNFRTLRIDKIPDNCDNFLYKCRSYDISFVEIYNSLPNIGNRDAKDENDCRTKIDDYRNHVKKVFNILDDNDGKVKFKICSYQDLYKENDAYFNKMKKVVSYYRLDEKCN